MVNTIVDGTLRQTNLTNESSEYLAKREELRLAEIELMRQRERLQRAAAQRRAMHPSQDYAFEEGPRDPRSVCDMFAAAKRGAMHPGIDARGNIRRAPLYPSTPCR